MLKSRNLNSLRYEIADKLMWFFLRKKINNPYALRLFNIVYHLLVKNVYILQHKNSNHHYVPQFLLKNFKIPNKGEIYEYRLNKKVAAISIRKHAANIGNLYTFRDKDTKLPSDFMEDQIFANAVERYTPFVMRKIIAGETFLTDLESSILATFVAFQYVRTPKFISQLKYLLTYLMKAKSISIEETLTEGFYKKAFIDNYYNVENENVANFFKENKITLSGKDIKAWLFKLAIQIASYIQLPIFRRNLCILRVSEPNFLTISDHPVAIFNLGKRDFINANIWELGDDLIIFLPLSPSVGIYYTNNRQSGEDIDNSYATYDFMQMLSLSNMHESIFSDRQSEDINKLFNKT